MNTDNIDNGHEVVVAAPLSSEYVYNAVQIVEILVVEGGAGHGKRSTQTLLPHPHAT